VSQDSPALLWIVALGLSVVGSAGGLLVAASLVWWSGKVHTRLVPWLVSYAVGTLLGAALLVLVPEALESIEPPLALGVLLVGIITFFVLEKLVLWRHSHDDETDHVHKSTATLVILGDAVHTFVDGVVIAAATLTSLPLGLSTALALIAHEIPQEAGDFGVLLAAGYTRRRALVLNLASALGGVAGASLMLAFGGAAPAVVPFVLAFAAGNLMYVAMSDLIPSLHRGHLDTNPVRQIVLISAGILTIAWLQTG
jgi:zinc and cadmium transporter